MYTLHNFYCIIAGAVAASGYFYPFSLWPHHKIDLSCTGIEDEFLNCPYNELSDKYNCPNTHFASIVCQSELFHLYT